ncbi:hypothetical protein B0T14DRAFT_11655 [Immersiella caudata]|uniref:Secreted protein n=1 Tax=Immersiella caudata TaxID=314043 RepID=A0AA39XD76_9PEZI|nr:hypothetical protein B0T14DRAFT_11655 [Immersiella caudata]
MHTGFDGDGAGMGRLAYRNWKRSLLLFVCFLCRMEGVMDARIHGYIPYPPGAGQDGRGVRVDSFGRGHQRRLEFLTYTLHTHWKVVTAWGGVHSIR